MDLTKLLALRDEALKRPVYPNTNFPPSEYYRFFEVLTAEVRPALSIELGVNGGGGSLHLARGYRDGYVVGVDVGNEYPDNIKYIQEHYKNFIFWVENSLTSAPKIVDQYGIPDIVFFDTVHEVGHVMTELDIYKSLLSEEKCIFIFDDLWRATMRGFWEKIPQPKLRMDELHPGSTEGGFGVWLYNYTV